MTHRPTKKESVQFVDSDKSQVPRDQWIMKPEASLAIAAQQIAARDQAIDRRDRMIAELDQTVTNLSQIVAHRDNHIAHILGVLAHRDEQIAGYQRALVERDHHISAHETALGERDTYIAHLAQQVANRSGELAEIRASASWRFTAPLRRIRSLLARLLRARARPGDVTATSKEKPSPVTSGNPQNEHNDLPTAIPSADLSDDSPAQFPITNANVPAASEANEPTPDSLKDDRSAIAPSISVRRSPKLSIVPHYFDPNDAKNDWTKFQDISIAIHFHATDSDALLHFQSRLMEVTIPVDLFVSVCEPSNSEAIRAQIQEAVPCARDVVVEVVPRVGGSIAPFIVQFGERLARYQIVGHFHGPIGSPTRRPPSSYLRALDILLGLRGDSGRRVRQVVHVLQADAKLVYPEASALSLDDPSGWGPTHTLARELLEAHSKVFIGDFVTIDYPDTTMFWSRASCLAEYLTLPLHYDDFVQTHGSADCGLEDALARLPLVFASAHEGNCYRIHTSDSIPDYRLYEEQHDYSQAAFATDTRVLSFYLPQFHAIPENDRWHGKGFTEWTKVRAANPLFEGHYQQHMPHRDLGYYVIDSSEVLRRQAAMMRKAGVYGQVFYHYDFGSKLLLEEPAQLLLTNRDIEMPFCFCWANENWTRRWDGDEQNILLEQRYSAVDAQNFIRYLIPFFRDRRYIKVADRPVLFVYRPSSVPDATQYLRIWADECARAEIGRPFVVAVLTRGATDPRDFGMDAGAERVLQDWTAGGVRDIRERLAAYDDLRGSVLPYDQVVHYYTDSIAAKSFPWFRSVVPNWDNTARYGADALLLHGSSPQRFQDWLQHCISHAREFLPEDRRFVLINAWNEWAEGAHLEPDSRFGYSYLNSVGRALSGISYADEFQRVFPLPERLRVHISLSKNVIAQLRKDVSLATQFGTCLRQTTVLGTCDCTLSPAVAEILGVSSRAVLEDADEGSVHVEFRRISLFAPTLIERLLQIALQFPNSYVVANAYGDGGPLAEVTGNGSVDFSVAQAAPILVCPRVVARAGFANCRMRTDAHSFVTTPSATPVDQRPRLSTIIRFHKSNSVVQLEDALFCLAAMRDCVVVPLIATQDLDETQMGRLHAILHAIPFIDDVEPQVFEYRTPHGSGDVRSKMLCETLLQVTTRYAAFLDFDDLLASDAYAWLIHRLRSTGKAVAFGRVYVTNYVGATGVWLERKRTFGGRYTYEEFRQYNLAPIHSFALDLKRLDLSRIYYHEEQRYMEDYFLTLQLFSADNVDWESLEEEKYIGDYIHSVDRPHTLAFTDDAERQALLELPEYQLCVDRIYGLRRATHF